MTRAAIISLREVPAIVGGLAVLIGVGAWLQWYWLAAGGALLLLLVGNFSVIRTGSRKQPAQTCCWRRPTGASAK